MSTHSEPGFGALVISLDFELHWGVRDKHRPDGEYRPALMGAREVIPEILDLFARYEVAATWATVGFLFAHNRDELERHSPELRPAYLRAELNPYDETIGRDEADDPLHFAPSLIETIRATPRQELATHTFSHYFCTEQGQTAETFRADLRAAKSIAAARGTRLASIVFPRNQDNRDYATILREEGIRAYRGNPVSWMWRFEDAEDSARIGKRLARLVDQYVGIGGNDTVPWEEVRCPSGLANVRASRFLRPYLPRLAALESARFHRIRGSLEAAAKRREIFHLWWHPHNMGLYRQQNLAMLRRVLDAFARYRDRYGMRSLSMSEVADIAYHGRLPQRDAGEGRVSRAAAVQG